MTSIFVCGIRRRSSAAFCPMFWARAWHAIWTVTGPESGDSRRRYYDLTKQGRDIFDMELKRMEAMVRKSKALRLERAEPAQ